MSAKLPTEFKGTLYFYWSPQYEHMIVLTDKMDGYILLGKFDVEYDFGKPDLSEVAEVFERQIKEVRDESARQIYKLENLKAKYLSLEHITEND